MFEDEPTNLPLGISICRLSKTYTSGLPLKRKKVKAVRNLSLNFYEGQITAFLGHNGAGKTTTMSVLTGLYEPTSGTAQVYGQDIRSNMDDIRHSLGLCPQHNILFDLLTVKEHLLFYGMMRGLSYQHISSTIPSWLSKVGLLAHADKMSMHLSGGMKRKLSVLLAFVGESQTIILDEPTSGVDPFARRQIWDFLLRHRDNRTVMLSTHHMDEAEILGDRIAILSQGSLICSGSFEFLRHNYGKGHRLSLVTHPHSTLLSSSSSAVRSSSNQRDEEGQEETDSGGAPPVSSTVDSTVLVSRLIQNLIPSARMEEHRGREMRFLLPLHQARPQTLKLLFSQLETRANEVGVASYGLTACSMEEIFVQLTHKEVAVAPDDSSSSMVPRPSLHSISLDDTTSLDSRSSDRGSDTRETTVTLGDEEEEGADDVDSVFQLLPNNESIGEQEEEEELEEGKRVVGGYGNEGYQGPHLKGPQLWLTQAAALLLKRLQYTYRRSLATAVQTILPLFLIILGLGIANQLQDVPDQQPLELTPSLFFKVSPENYMFTGGCDDDERWNYTSSFSLPLSYLDYLSSTANTTTSSSSSQYIDPDLELPFSLPNSTFFQLTSPAPAEYLSSLFQPCGIGASESDSDVCGVMMGEGEGVCQVVPGLRCSSVCGECSVFDSNSSLFPVEPPFCFDGSVSRTKIQSVSMKCEDSLDGQEEANLRLISYLLGSKADFIEVRYGGVSFGHVRSEVNESLDAWNTVEGDDWPFLATRQAAKAWYSFKGYHALPAYVNTLSNAILRGHMPANVSTGPIGVQTFSHPFKYSELKRIFYAVTERRTFLVNPLAAIFNLGFIAASFVLFLIEERSGKTFHLQLVCGMSRVVYWLTTALWDLLTYLAFIFLVIMLYIFFQDQYFSDPAILPTVVLLLISFGAAVTPWMYLLSFLFRSPATAYIALFCLNFFSGFSLLIVDAIIVYINGLSMGTNFIIPHLLALPFPSYPLARSLLYASLDRPLKRVALVYEGKQLPHPLQDLWPFLLSLWIQAVVYVAIMIVVQFCPNFITPKCRRPVNIPEVGCDDENVEREERKVRQTNQTNGDILTLRGLTKVYNQCSLRDNSRVAVNRLDLSMKPSECFGLLGVNGAGKTTTFRMLTGDTSPTLGDALILGRSVQERSVVQKAVGYCPQVDALIDQLTGRQHLTLYSRLRGVPRAKVSGVVEWALQRLDLMQHADKPAGQYSGGNRRRLSAAIALLGSPQLLLLDEPTSGVDPAARQFLWSVIRSVASSGQSVLLTTHSMAECEALCSRVGIMVNGTFRCLGTPQQLKSGYGDGYRLKLRVRGELDPIQQFITRHFPNSTLKEKHLNTLIYQLPLAGLKLSEAFRDLEKGRETLEIRDYSLSQTTLDDVFIHFASQQSEGPCEMEEEEERKVDGKEKKGISHLFSQRVNHSNGSVRYTVVRDDVTIT